ncbi:hypothetical protein HRbin27_01365 [bacterium HR27]|nr:hypothetical protein HRbin27_01365 [bacterium HR27]
MVRADIECLKPATPVQVPNMNTVTVFPGQEFLSEYAVFDHPRCAPLARDHRVVAEVPPEVVVEILVATIDLPPSEHLERVMVEDENATGAFSFRSPECRNVDAVRTAVHGVGPGVIGALVKFFRLDHLDDARCGRIFLRIEDRDVRTPDVRDDEVAAFDVWVRCIRAEHRAARVPSEVVQLTTSVGHLGGAHDLAVGAG